jgi:hypothetical protein
MFSSIRSFRLAFLRPFVELRLREYLQCRIFSISKYTSMPSSHHQVQADEGMGKSYGTIRNDGAMEVVSKVTRETKETTITLSPASEVEHSATAVNSGSPVANRTEVVEPKMRSELSSIEGALMIGCVVTLVAAVVPWLSTSS